MIDKLIPRYLETSKDGRSKGSSELIDALNITVTGDSEGGQGVVKNIKGTQAVVMSLPSNQMPEGENTCIGSVRDEGLGVVYFFVHNTEGNHGIYAYSAKTNTYRLIFMDESLDFQENGFVKADVVRLKRRAKDVEFIIGAGEDEVGFEEEEVEEEEVGPVFNICDYINEETGLIDQVSSVLFNIDAGINGWGFDIAQLFIADLGMSAGELGCSLPPDAPDEEPLQPLAFTGNLCAYPGIQNASGLITATTISAQFEVAMDLLNSGLTHTELTYVFPDMNNDGFIGLQDKATAIASLPQGTINCSIIDEGDVETDSEADVEAVFDICNYINEETGMIDSVSSVAFNIDAGINGWGLDLAQQFLSFFGMSAEQIGCVDPTTGVGGEGEDDEEGEIGEGLG